MHIPENYLSPSTCAVMTAAMLPVWGYSINKIRTEIPKAKMPLLGIGAAFSFLGMMFNVPLPGGTTGHAVGGTLIAILTGSPAAGCISVSIALLIQALLFGDGGILAFGANCFNMAFVLPYLGFFLYQLLLKKTGKRKLSAAIGAYVGINAAAFCAAVEFGIQPLLFKNVAGQALYCPYPLSVSIPVMLRISCRQCIQFPHHLRAGCINTGFLFIVIKIDNRFLLILCQFHLLFSPFRLPPVLLYLYAVPSTKPASAL